MKKWIQLWTGGRICPLAPTERNINIIDIAHALSQLCRYTGQGCWYSVAEHCLLVSRSCQTLAGKRYGLLHDAAEAYIGDLNAPTKHQLELKAYRDAEARLEVVINRAFRVSPVFEVLRNDKLIRNDEVPYVFPRRIKQWKLGKRLGVVIRGLPPAEAEVEFITEYRHLFWRASHSIQTGRR